MRMKRRPTRKPSPPSAKCPPKSKFLFWGLPFMDKIPRDRRAGNAASLKRSEVTSCLMAVHASAVEYSKISIQYMFLANGGAVTTLLLRFEIKNYFIPIMLFSFGVAYSVLIPIVMYFRYKNELSNNKFRNVNNIVSIHKSTSYRFLMLCAMYLPMLFFIFGIMMTIDIFTYGVVRSPLKIVKDSIQLLLQKI